MQQIKLREVETMGLFDKLRDKVNGFLKTGEVTVVEKDDPMTTKYYEGILSLLSTVNRLTDM